MDEVAYLLSFLAILVQRAGGTLAIEHLSQFASTSIGLKMSLDADHDRVTLTTVVTPRSTPPTRGGVL